MRVVVLEKVYGPHEPREFTPAFLSLCYGLSVNVQVVGSVGRGWLVLELSGEDEEVALRLIAEEIGLAPVRASEIRRFSKVRGKVLAVTSEGAHIDIGVFEPMNLDALVSLKTLRAQLADGLYMDMATLSRLFCLSEGFPLEVRLLEGPGGASGEFLRAELSEGQVRAFERWVRSGLDRVVVLGVSHHALKRALWSSGFYEQAIEIERLGLLEHAILLKLGASSRKLVSALRRRLKKATILAFRPGEIMRAFPGRYSSTAL